MDKKERKIFVTDEVWDRVLEVCKMRHLGPSSLLVELFDGGGEKGCLARIETKLGLIFPDARKLTEREVFKLKHANEFCPQCMFRYRDCECP